MSIYIFLSLLLRPPKDEGEAAVAVTANTLSTRIPGSDLGCYFCSDGSTLELHKAHIVTLQFKVDSYHNSVSSLDAKT